MAPPKTGTPPSRWLRGVPSVTAGLAGFATREGNAGKDGQASSWYNRSWALPAKHDTKNSLGKRATRGYQSDYDDWSRQWEDSKPSGSTKDNEGVTEVAIVEKVEVVENRDRYHRRVATDTAASTAPAHSTWDSATAMSTEKEAVRTRLGD